MSSSTLVTLEEVGAQLPIVNSFDQLQAQRASVIVQLNVGSGVGNHRHQAASTTNAAASQGSGEAASNEPPMPTRVVTHGAPSMPSLQATGSQGNHYHFHFHQQQSSLQSHFPASDEGTVNQEIEPGENEPALSNAAASSSAAAQNGPELEPLVNSIDQLQAQRASVIVQLNVGSGVGNPRHQAVPARIFQVASTTNAAASQGSDEAASNEPPMPTGVITHGAPSMPSLQATGSQGNHYHFYFHQQQSSLQSHSPASDEGTVNQEIEPGENEPGENEPVENEPGENEPVENEPGEKEPGENAPGENEPGENEPVENEPGEKEPGENAPGENEPGENEPALSNTAASSSAAAQNGPAQFDPKNYLKVVYELLEPSKQAQTKVITLSLQCTEPNCPDTFGKDELDRHMSEKHLLRQFRCEVKDCRKSFDRWLTRENHVKHAHQPTRFDCDKCAHGYSSYHKLSTHKYRCHQLGQFRCAVPSCTFEAVRISQITDHSKQQHKTLYCGHGDCPYLNIDPRKVMSHRRKHTAVKPYRCVWPACVYASKQRHNAIQHILKHHSMPNAGSVRIEIGSDEEEGEDESDGKSSEDNESGPAAKRPKMEPTQPARGVIIGEFSRQPTGGVQEIPMNNQARIKSEHQSMF